MSGPQGVCSSDFVAKFCGGGGGGELVTQTYLYSSQSSSINVLLNLGNINETLKIFHNLVPFTMSIL